MSENTAESQVMEMKFISLIRELEYQSRRRDGTLTGYQIILIW